MSSLVRQALRQRLVAGTIKEKAQYDDAGVRQ
jgi:hypothetical protein